MTSHFEKSVDMVKSIKSKLSNIMKIPGEAGKIAAGINTAWKPKTSKIALKAMDTTQFYTGHMRNTVNEIMLINEEMKLLKPDLLVISE